jgi:hypothetical protein
MGFPKTPGPVSPIAPHIQKNKPPPPPPPLLRELETQANAIVITKTFPIYHYPSVTMYQLMKLVGRMECWYGSVTVHACDSGTGLRYVHDIRIHRASPKPPSPLQKGGINTTCQKLSLLSSLNYYLLGLIVYSCRVICLYN